MTKGLCTADHHMHISLQIDSVFDGNAELHSSLQFGFLLDVGVLLWESQAKRFIPDNH